ncbi:hypothetical protein BJP36_40055 [Moorena producens JHB]|uniref:Uncharacterized protein n=1 Tax=Moorena producens (strain JHB) TaxID=1454205 RepID=A0A9Q9SRY5_MOOP1|nr:hypothetical protein [Moorena producens]WAN68572.1 hypothetical protein BJP36_40055 [Moorena producens JHB]
MNNPQSNISKAYEPEATSSEEITMNELGAYVAAPGAVGGLTKIVLELVQPPSTIPVNPPACSSFLCLVPANLFLGMISAVIGTFLLSDVLVFRKSKFKVIGLALTLGLFFPSVFSTASTITNLNLEVQEATQQKNQAIQATIATNQKLAITSGNNKVKQDVIQTINTLGKNSADPQVKKNAIQNIESVAKDSKDTTVKQQAVKSLEDLGTNSQNLSVKKDAISALETLKIDASPTLQNQVNQSINNLKQ